MFCVRKRSTSLQAWKVGVEGSIKSVDEYRTPSSSKSTWCSCDVLLIFFVISASIMGIDAALRSDRKLQRLVLSSHTFQISSCFYSAALASWLSAYAPPSVVLDAVTIDRETRSRRESKRSTFVQSAFIV